MAASNLSVPELGDEQLRALYAWIDAIPLSRPKKNITRDFSDGLLFAEVIHAYFPHLVEIHNYVPANSLKQKHYNFDTLNQKVLRKIGYVIPRETIDDIVCCRPGAVEFVLHTLQYKMAKYREKKSNQNTSHGSMNSSGGVENKVEVSEVQINKSNSNAPQIHNLNHQESYSKLTLHEVSQQMSNVNDEIIKEQAKEIRELKETIDILELKIGKLEQLVRLKDNKIEKLISSRNSNN